jgi:hypothetical protein
VETGQNAGESEFAVISESPADWGVVKEKVMSERHSYAADASECGVF